MKKINFLLLAVACCGHIFSQALTVRQAFNFSVGDTFEYSYTAQDYVGPWNSTGSILDIITSVQQNGDTITYGYSAFTAANAPCYGTYSVGQMGTFPSGAENGWPFLPSLATAASHSGFFEIFDLDSMVFNSYISPYLGSCDTPYCHITNFSSPSQYNGKSQTSDTSNTLSNIRETYADSIGLVSRNNFYEEDVSEIVMENMVYYYKAATHETWGQRSGANFVSSIENIQNRTEVKVFPNPASDYVSLAVSNLPSVPVKFIIIDITGREILSLPVNSPVNEIARGTLAAGIYEWHLNSPDGTLAHGRLVFR